ncbi:hypothetical protein MMC10_010410 [Thelotrema lepadinum]|nr:hypothetical protein [Thelotrema lepadinum]
MSLDDDEQLETALKFIATTDLKRLNRCIEKVREIPGYENSNVKRIIINLDSDTETEQEQASKRPKTADSRKDQDQIPPREVQANSTVQSANNQNASPAPAPSLPSSSPDPSSAQSTTVDCDVQPTAHQNVSSVPCQSLNTSSPISRHPESADPTNLPARPSGPVPSKEEQSSILLDGLKKRLTDCRSLVQTCPCELKTRLVENEDFRLRDIRNEINGTNTFKASLAYLSLALEFHEYEVKRIQTEYLYSAIQPRLHRLYNKDYNNSSKYTPAWICEKGLKENKKLVIQHVNYGQRICLLRKRIADGLGLEECQGSIISVLIRTFLSKKLVRLSWTNLEKNVASLIADQEVRQLIEQHQDWFKKCNIVYHHRNGLPEGFQHTCSRGHSNSVISCSQPVTPTAIGMSNEAITENYVAHAESVTALASSTPANKLQPTSDVTTNASNSATDNLTYQLFDSEQGRLGPLYNFKQHLTLTAANNYTNGSMSFSEILNEAMNQYTYPFVSEPQVEDSNAILNALIIQHTHPILPDLEVQNNEISWSPNELL